MIIPKQNTSTMQLKFALLALYMANFGHSLSNILQVLDAVNADMIRERKSNLIPLSRLWKKRKLFMEINMTIPKQFTPDGKTIFHSFALNMERFLS